MKGKSVNCLLETAEGTIVLVKAAPRSSKPGIDSMMGDSLKIRVRSAPVDGKANKELTEVIAKSLGLSKSSVVFKSGETSKTKRILLVGVGIDKAREAIESCLR
jgi:uncharacterized protein (TIGR00251 family)